MEIKRAVTNVRAVVLFAIFIVLFSILLGRVLFIQVSKEVNGQELEALAEQNWGKTKPIKGKRGTIYDRNGGALAQEVNSYTVFAVLNKDFESYVKDPAETAKALAPLINTDESELEKWLSSPDRFQVELGSGSRNLSYAQMKEIEALELPGIYFHVEPKRYYPKHTYASHVIGYMDRNEGKAVMGLERSLAEQLKPKDGVIEYRADRKGFPLPNPNQHITPANDGNHIYLTLDSNIQTALEQVMTKVDEQYEPERMVAIVADPKTGQILAMSNRPSFNPNEYEQITNYMNFAISDHFEPGSTMKMFTVAAAMEEGLYNGGEYFQSGQLTIGPDTVSDHNQGLGWGEITYDEGFLRSSNVAVSKIALEKLGSEKYYEYLEKFGFGQPTGIDLPNEANSLIARGAQYDTAASAFGQGTAVTPIQQIQAATAIANGGKMMRPYVIDRIVDANTNEIIEQHEPEAAGEPISEQTADNMLDLMEKVISSSEGTGRPYYLEGFQVAGKTGTAQIRNPEGGGYLTGHGNNIFSFIGMAPKMIRASSFM